MKKLLNALFVLTEDAYLSLDGENVVVNRDKEVLGRFPLHTLESIFCFSYAGASPALMGACAARCVNFAFCTPNGRFLARVVGQSHGNVLLRRTQYRIADDPAASCAVARNFIFGKVYNARWSIERTRRDHGLRIDDAKLGAVSASLKELLPTILEMGDTESLRGLEGAASVSYFRAFDEMILADRAAFYFRERSRRPPLDNVNALLSFAYALLANDCASALETVGLDSFVGFLHKDRSGRASLAADLMEELRPCMADRFVLTLINNRVITASDMLQRESSAVQLSDAARRAFLKAWQERKRDTLTHPYLKEKMAWGLVPYVQALLLARCLRGDIDAYPPFLWK